MGLKIDFSPYPGSPYFTVQEHQRHFNKMEGYDPKSDLIAIEAQLRDLLNIPSADYKFQLLNLADRENFMEKCTIFCKDDPQTGIDLLSGVPKIHQNALLDLTYSFPQISENTWNFNAFFIDPNGSLGVPAGFGVVFTRMDFEGFLAPFSIKEPEGFGKDIYVLKQVLSNLKDKGKDMLLRESNYKAAVLYQMIDSCEHLEPIADKKKRSKSMIVAKCDLEFLNKLEKLGYQVGTGPDEQITIANYPTHSKELIEMFADRVVEL